jgi:RHS repeat-associated protein
MVDEPATAYSIENGQFVRYTQGVAAPTQVSAEEGASHMIAGDVAGVSQIFISTEGTVTVGGVTVPTDDIAQAEVAAVNEIEARPGLTDAQRYEQMHRAFGDNPTTVAVGVQALGVDAARAIWGDAVVAQAAANTVEHADDPAPSNVIQGSGTQGVGPVPSSPGGDDTGTGSGRQPAGAQRANAAASDTQRQGTAASPRADPRSGGDPVLLASGQLFAQVTDLSVRGRGIGFAFTRTYLHQTAYRGPVGCSWDHSYNLWLREARELQPDGSYANVVYRSTGEVREDRYVEAAVADGGPAPPDASFQGPAGFFDQLTRTAGRYRLQMVNGTVIDYNENLYVAAVTDISGNALTFSYDADGRLVAVVDPVGKRFLIANDSHGRVVEVLDETAGRRVAYAYDDLGNLIEADVYADADTVASTDYVYLGADAPPGLEHNLIEVIGADGQSSLAVNYSADPDPLNFNRVIDQRSLDGAYLYEYELAGPVDDPHLADFTNLPVIVVRVTYPNGHVIEHSFNRQGNVVQRREQVGVIGPGAASIETLIAVYTYNNDGLLQFEQRPDGATVTYEYAVDRYETLHGAGTAGQAPGGERLGFGNVLRRVETARDGSGEVRQLVTEWDYFPGGPRVQHQKGPYYADVAGVELPGQATPDISYEYDGRGRLTKIDYGSAQTADGNVQPLAANEFSHDASGNLTDARTGPIRTHYDYFADVQRSGFVRRRVEDADGLARKTIYELDSAGRLTARTDSFGAVARWEYNGFDLVVKATLPAVAGTAPVTSYAYDRMRRVSQTIQTLVRGDGSAHPDGALVTRYRYENGRVTEVTAGPLNGSLQLVSGTVYTPAGQPRRVRDATGVITELDYDPRGLLSRVRMAPGTAVQAEQHFTYNRSGELSAAVDAAGNATRIERDGFGRIARITDRDGIVWETEHDAQDRPVVLRVIGPAPGGGAPIAWAEARQDFDRAGRLMRRRDLLFVPGDPTVVPREVVTSYLYDTLSRLVEIRRGAQTIETRSYDGLGRVVESADADGNTVKHAYDDGARKHVITTMDRELGSAPPRFQCFRTEISLDVRGLAVQTLDTLGNAAQQSYDSRGLLETLTLPGGEVVANSYDAFGLLRQQTHQGSAAVARAITSYEYDAAGRITAQVTPVGDRTEWSYDTRGLLIASDGPDGLRAVDYDGEGRPVRSRLPSGLEVRSTYSGEGRLLTLEADSSGYTPPAALPGYAPIPITSAAYSYTPDGRLRRAVDDTAVEFTFDSLGRVITETGPGGTIRYGWDDAGRRTRLVYPGGRRIAYSYSPGGRLVSVSQAARGAAYPGAGTAASARTLLEIARVGTRPLRANAPGIADQRFSYDAGARLVGIDYGNAPEARIRVLRSGSGRRVLEQHLSGVRALQSDALGRLRRAIDHDVGGAALDPAPLAPAPDEAGLATVKHQNDIDAEAAALTAAAGPELRSFEYVLDADGNRRSTTIRIDPAAPVVAAYATAPGDRYLQAAGQPTVYDLDGNLLSDGVRTFRYDSLGRLRAATDAAGTTAATYDPLSRLATVTAGGVSQPCRWAGPELVEYGRGASRAQLVPGDRPKAPVHVAAGGQELIPLADDTGSVLGWVGQGGALVGTRQQDPYGHELATTGAQPVPLGAGGHLVAPGGDLHWLYARVYDARLGRFLQPDPMGFIDGPNIYAFARDAPGTFVDLTGYASNDIDWGTVAQTGAVTAGAGIGLAIVGGILVGAGAIAAPDLAVVAGIMMLEGAIESYAKRSDEALAAGKTADPGRLALLAVGDTAGVPGIYEGLTGRDAVTDRTLGRRERSTRLGSALGTAAAFLAGPKAVRIGRAGGARLAGGLEPAPGPPAIKSTEGWQPKADITEADMLAPLKAEALGGQRIWVVGPEGASTTRGIRFRGNLVAYDGLAPATGGMVKQDMGVIANQFGGKGATAGTLGDWVTGTHGQPDGAFLGRYAEPKFYFREVKIGPHTGWSVYNVGQGFPSPSTTRPLVLNWCYSSAARLPPLDPMPPGNQ